MNTSSINPTSAPTGRRIAEALARWMQRWTDAIDATPPVTGHRMGSWEASISSNLQAARQPTRSSETRKKP